MPRRLRKFLMDYLPLVVKAGLIKGLPGLYPLLEIKPTSCTIILTDRCNLKCVMCKQWRRPPAKELEASGWKKIIDDLAVNGIKNIHFTGGEPLVRYEDLLELSAHARDRSMTIGFTTNGMLLDENRMKDLVKSGIVSIALSIDALDGKYEMVRGKGSSFARVRDASHVLADFRKKKLIDSYINFTLMRDTLSCFRDVKKFADGLDLPVAVCLLDRSSYIFDIEENKRDFWILTKEDFSALEAFSHFLSAEKIRRPASLLLNFPMIGFIEGYFKDPRQERIPCISSQDRIIIDPCGNLMGGCLSMGTFGNLNGSRLAGLTGEENYAAAKRNMFYKRCEGCSCGYQFNVKSFVPLIFSDFLKRVKCVCLNKN